ncbi:MAG: ribonuclease D [Thermoanaerobaculia bacterium]
MCEAGLRRIDFTWVTDRAGLLELASCLAESPWHALDSESNSGFVYRERLCLLQLNVAGRLWLVDLLALEEGERSLEPLRPALESSEQTTYVHGGEFDVGCLKRDYAIALGGVWDSQQAASFLGWEKTGYGVLVERICGVRLPKAYAHYDWSRRPLDQEPLAYALSDVDYLPRVCEQLRREVRAADLEEEVGIANRAVEQATWSSLDPSRDFWRVKGVRRLPESALPVLAALLDWRETTARRLDRPPGLLLNNELLLAISRSQASDLDSLRRLGFRGRRLRELGVELIATLRSAHRRPPEVSEPPPRRRREPAEEKRRERLRSWRREEAERRGVPQRVVLPAVALRHLQREGAEDLDSVPQLGAKRIARYGRRLRELCGVADSLGHEG